MNKDKIQVGDLVRHNYVHSGSQVESVGLVVRIIPQEEWSYMIYWFCHEKVWSYPFCDLAKLEIPNE